jgi:hypothetical protein
MARYKRPKPHRKRYPRRITEKEFPRNWDAIWRLVISGNWDAIWWLVKKILLVLSAITDIAVIVVMVINLVKGQRMLLSGIGIAIGLLLMAWALGSVSRFRVSVLRAVMVAVITAIYAVFFFAFIGLVNI